MDVTALEDAVCDRGARCEVTCDGAASCLLRCRRGAKCLLRCRGGGSCRIADCYRTITYCPGGVSVCGRGCP